ncbi:MAG: metal-dependent transcriptional regulator [Lachnospiraceae bacterium]|nr:metal-dependent transcriptional regulator [Lachnospiraceae bacterium]
MKKSDSSENYLKNILILHKRLGRVRSSDVAEKMGVTRPSVSSAMKKLRQEEMIYFNEEGYIFFTELGKKIAEKIYSKHLLLTRLLVSMGVSESVADQEACDIEHAISDETYECINRFYKTHIMA